MLAVHVYVGIYIYIDIRFVHAPVRVDLVAQNDCSKRQQEQLLLLKKKLLIQSNNNNHRDAHNTKSQSPTVWANGHWFSESWSYGEQTHPEARQAFAAPGHPTDVAGTGYTTTPKPYTNSFSASVFESSI